MNGELEWKVLQPPNHLVEDYMASLNVGRIVASAFVNQKLPKETVAMIMDARYADIYRPLNLCNIREAAVLIKEYIGKQNVTIVVFADYDTDGITSAAIADKGLTRIINNVYPGKDIPIWYRIPERKEGYGLNDTFVEQMTLVAKNNPDMEYLIITVDNGITAKPFIQKLQAEPNICVLVTDHHEPDYENDLTPTDICICVDPRLDPSSPGQNLAGCGVIFNVLQKLEEVCWLKHEVTQSLYYLNAIGTIGDMMNFDLYNMTVIQRGLFQLNQEPMVSWVKKAHNITKIDMFTTKDVAFTLSPIINSCGQMGHALKPFLLLTARTEDDTTSLFDDVYQIYNQNKAETKEAKKYAELDIMENYIDKHKFIMYPMQTEHPGLASKVATHLGKTIGRPIILWAETEENADEEIIAGSARNDTKIPVLDILRSAVRNGLAEAAEGHSYAFGVKIKRAKIPQLQKYLDDEVDQYEQAHNGVITIDRTCVIDCLASTDEINVKTMNDMASFPFLKNVPLPVVKIQGAKIYDARPSKNNPRNVCYTIQSPDASHPIDVWVWDIKSDKYDKDIHTKVDMIGTVERDFRNPKCATLKVSDLRFY